MIRRQRLAAEGPRPDAPAKSRLPRIAVAPLVLVAAMLSQPLLARRSAGPPGRFGHPPGHSGCSGAVHRTTPGPSPGDRPSCPRTVLWLSSCCSALDPGPVRTVPGSPGGLHQAPCTGDDVSCAPATPPTCTSPRGVPRHGQGEPQQRSPGGADQPDPLSGADVPPCNRFPRPWPPRTPPTWHRCCRGS